MSYTKGPWAPFHAASSICVCDDRKEPITSIEDIENGFLCEIFGKDAVDNAYLIAKAPDMLEELENSISLFEYYYDRFKKNMSDNEATKILKQMNNMRKIISEAKGEDIEIDEENYEKVKFKERNEN